MKITIGVTTYNRLGYVRMMARSLRSSQALDRCSVRIYDDCSSEYGVDRLRELFPFAAEIRRRERNLGSDFNIRQMYLDFLATGDDILINCDSDMIFRDDWITRIEQLLPATDGVLSCYNSALHPAIAKVELGGETMVSKEHLGSAGTAFTRSVVEVITSQVAPSRRFDWDWSQHLTNAGIRLLVTEQSYLQHIGIVGYNCDAARSIDYGLNFFPDNDDTARINVGFFERLVQAKQKVVEQQNDSYYFQLPKYKVLQLVIEPLSRLKRRLKIGRYRLPSE